jgi:hypothetical protein
MKVSEKQVLSVRCPTCGAKPGEKCELSTGQARTDPHRDRRLAAAEKVVQIRRLFAGEGARATLDQRFPSSAARLTGQSEQLISRADNPLPEAESRVRD